jgi:hypothetical protein
MTSLTYSVAELSLSHTHNFTNPKLTNKMKTEITKEQADILTDIIAVPKEFADFIGITTHTDILDMSAEGLATDGDITVEQAETILLAASLSEEPNIWGAYQVLMSILNN